MGIAIRAPKESTDEGRGALTAEAGQAEEALMDPFDEGTTRSAHVVPRYVFEHHVAPVTRRARVFRYR